MHKRELFIYNKNIRLQANKYWDGKVSITFKKILVLHDSENDVVG